MKVNVKHDYDNGFLDGFLSGYKVELGLDSCPYSYLMSCDKSKPCCECSVARRYNKDIGCATLAYSSGYSKGYSQGYIFSAECSKDGFGPKNYDLDGIDLDCAFQMGYQDGFYFGIMKENEDDEDEYMEVPEGIYMNETYEVGWEFGYNAAFYYRNVVACSDTKAFSKTNKEGYEKTESAKSKYANIKIDSNILEFMRKLKAELFEIEAMANKKAIRFKVYDTFDTLNNLMEYYVQTQVNKFLIEKEENDEY